MTELSKGAALPIRPERQPEAAIERDAVLFTPGPLTTSQGVKSAMLRDLGSRDSEFLAVVDKIRRRLLEIAGADPSEYVAVPMQGSGTFGLTHVAAVHCETTSGIMNPAAEIGLVARQAGARYVLDAMSSFGAVPIDMPGWGVDYLVSSSNKCIEGVPGFSFVLARRAALEETSGNARTLSLDLVEQWRGLESNGQFRFTPPTHALLACQQALAELEEEGGVEGRARRYRRNTSSSSRGCERSAFASTSRRSTKAT